MSVIPRQPCFDLQRCRLAWGTFHIVGIDDGGSLESVVLAHVVHEHALRACMRGGQGCGVSQCGQGVSQSNCPVLGFRNASACYGTRCSHASGPGTVTPPVLVPYIRGVGPSLILRSRSFTDSAVLHRAREIVALKARSNLDASEYLFECIALAGGRALFLTL